jgi:hypothetical protein
VTFITHCKQLLEDQTKRIKNNGTKSTELEQTSITLMIRLGSERMKDLKVHECPIYTQCLLVCVLS